MIPRKKKFILSITVAYILSTGIFKALLIILCSVYFYLLTLRGNLFTFNHSLILANSLFMGVSTFIFLVKVLND